MSKVPQSRTVRITRIGQFCHIRPRVKALKKHLYTSLHLNPNYDEMPGVLPIQCPLVWNQKTSYGDKIQACRAGLLPVVRECLKSLGYRVTVKRFFLQVHLEWSPKQRKTKGWFPRPGGHGHWLAAWSPESLKGHGNVDAQVLEFVRRNEQGMIRYRSPVETAKIIAQAALAWKKHLILVLTKSDNQARAIAKKLSKRVEGVELILADISPREPLIEGEVGDSSSPITRAAPRIVVTRYGCGGLGPVQIEFRHIIFYTDPASIFSASYDLAVEGLNHARIARVYGFLPISRRLPPYLRGNLLSVFGLAEVHVPQHGYQDRNVEVHWSRIFGGGKLSHTADLVELKRYGLWRHDLRNRRIRQIFQAVQQNNWSEIVGLTDAHQRRLRRTFGKNPRIVLVVENLEHAFHLADKLALPILADLNAVEAKDYTTAQSALLEAGSKLTAHTAEPVIVTFAALERIARCDVLIRADGGCGLPPLPERLLKTPCDDDRPLLLIDFTDEHHSSLAKAHRARSRAYQERGWRNVGQPAPTPLEQFLNQRPWGLPL